MNLLNAQGIERPKKTTSFGLGLDVARVITNNNFSKGKNKFTSLNYGTSVFIERELLLNLSVSLALDLSKYQDILSYDVGLYGKEDGVNLISEYRSGTVNLSRFLLKIPFRFRVYYFSKPQFRAFIEPGIYWSKDIWTKFQDHYEQTLIFDEINQIHLTPPHIEFRQEVFTLNKSRLGLSVGIGVLLNTAKGKRIIARIQYKREKLNITSDFEGKVNILGLELRYTLGRSKKKTKAEKDNPTSE